jgi:hypothetical protein
MDEEDYKQALRKYAQVAIRKHRRYEIAEAIGCSRQTFSTFMSGGPLGVEYREALEEWLREHDYWVDLPQVSTKRVSEPRRMLGEEMRLLTELIFSDMSDEFVANRFLGFVTNYARGYEAEIRKQAE